MTDRTPGTHLQPPPKPAGVGAPSPRETLKPSPEKRADLKKTCPPGPVSPKRPASVPGTLLTPAQRVPPASKTCPPPHVRSSPRSPEVLLPCGHSESRPASAQPGAMCAAAPLPCPWLCMSPCQAHSGRLCSGGGQAPLERPAPSSRGPSTLRNVGILWFLPMGGAKVGLSWKYAKHSLFWHYCLFKTAFSSTRATVRLRVPRPASAAGPPGCEPLGQPPPPTPSGVLGARLCLQAVLVPHKLLYPCVGPHQCQGLKVFQRQCGSSLSVHR